MEHQKKKGETKIGLKAIASELPKEKRTHEIIKYIVGRMKEELDKKEMIL